MDYTIVTDSAKHTDMQKTIMVADAVRNGVNVVEELAAKGFTCDAAAIAKVMAADPEYKAHVEAFAKDAGFELGDANIDALGQFFMVWNEQEINRLYRGRTAVQTFGVKTYGDWLTEKIIFKLRELTTAKTGLYDDFSRAGYVNYNYGYDYRDTLRLEWALEVTKREEMVAGVMRRNAYKDKKDAILLTQDIWENDFFWKGTTIGNKRLYGVISEVNLRARDTLAVDFGSEDITVDQVIAQFRFFKQTLANDLQGNGDIDTLPIQIVMPIKWQTALTVPNSYNGYTANTWLSENWKNATVSFKPELNDLGDGGDGLMIVYATSVPGVGMDTMNLARTSALRLVGAMPTLKGREEAYSSSVAGALCACPLGIRFYENDGSES